MPTDPNTDIERETTGEPYAEGNMETDMNTTTGGSSVEDLESASDDTPDSLATDDGDADDSADSLSVRGVDERPDSAP